MIRLNTHAKTPSPKTPKHILFLLYAGVGLMCLLCVLVAFACFYYVQNVIGSMLIIMLPTVLIIWCQITIRDMSKAYIEIDGDTIRVVDYYFGKQTERLFSFTDITSAEIALGGSHRVKGYRYSVMGTRYIILKKEGKYLFKIIHLPETERVFKSFL